MTYIVTKPMKSKGIAALLVFLFGGIGLFYATVTGGIVMTLLAPVAIFLFFFWGAATGNETMIIFVILFCCFYYIFCLIWALAAVGNYNKRNIAESNSYNTYANNSSIKDSNNQNKEIERKNISIWVLVFFCIGSIFFLLYYKGIIFSKKDNEKKDVLVKAAPTEKIKQNELRFEEKKKIDSTEKLSKKVFTVPGMFAWKVTSSLSQRRSNDEKMKPMDEDVIFIFYEKKIYKILNYSGMKIWHETKEYYEDEVQVIYTKEGDTFSIFGDITINYKSGKKAEYECDQIPIKNIHINEDFLK